MSNKLKLSTFFKNKKSYGYLAFVAILAFTVTGCDTDEEPEYLTSVAYDLRNTLGEWEAGFADYPLGGEREWELSSEENSQFTLLSGEVDTGFRLHSVNRSDDTQMYLSRKIQGLKPNRHYQVAFDIQIATNVNNECFGIGGAPHAVTVKASLSKNEPMTILDELDHYRLTIDTGSQIKGGLDAQSLGDIGLGILPDCDPSSDVYGLKNYNNENNFFEVTSDENGELWVTLLTDSGFEGPTSIYFTNANISFKESEKSFEGFTHVIEFSKEQIDVNSLFYDYPVGREEDWQLTSEPMAEVQLAQENKKITGHLLHSYNRNDDTGMLLFMPVKGLAPNSKYEAMFDVNIATNVNNMCSGVDGEPHSVYVKAALSSNKPKQVRVDNDEHYRLNIDLGNNAAEGSQGVTLGDIGSDSLKDCNPNNEIFDLKNFSTHNLQQNFTVETDDRGIVYFSLATDSDFEGPTTMLFTSGSVTFIKI